MRVTGSQANINYYQRAVRITDFSPTRSSLLELGLERARLECLFQTRADACGDPVSVQNVSSPTGLSGYEITVSSLTRSGPGTNDFRAKPYRPILALDARPYSNEIVLLLVWLEPTSAAAEPANPSALLRDFIANMGLEKALN